MIAYTFADAAALLALSRRLRYEGVASDVRMPRIVLTIRSSIRVIPLSSRASLLASARSIYTRIDGLAAVGDPRSRDASAPASGWRRRGTLRRSSPSEGVSPGPGLRLRDR